jgi:hypothetical protein
MIPVSYTAVGSKSAIEQSLGRKGRTWVWLLSTKGIEPLLAWCVLAPPQCAGAGLVARRSGHRCFHPTYVVGRGSLNQNDGAAA